MVVDLGGELEVELCPCVPCRFGEREWAELAGPREPLPELGGQAGDEVGVGWCG